MVKLKKLATGLLKIENINHKETDNKKYLFFVLSEKQNYSNVKSHFHLEYFFINLNLINFLDFYIIVCYNAFVSKNKI